LSPSVPEKSAVAQSTPAAVLSRAPRLSSSAMLKTSTISIENTIMALTVSRERSSAARSFQTTAPMTLK